jgi:hypothetical protein
MFEFMFKSFFSTYGNFNVFSNLNSLHLNFPKNTFFQYIDHSLLHLIFIVKNSFIQEIELHEILYFLANRVNNAYFELEVCVLLFFKILIL